DVADRLLETLKPMIAALKIGPGTDPGVEMGPLVTGDHLARVRSYIEIGVAEGARLVADGRNVKGSGDGFFLGPCLFDHVRPEMRIYREEIFGPVLGIVRVASLAEALQLVN